VINLNPDVDRRRNELSRLQLRQEYESHAPSSSGTPNSVEFMYYGTAFEVYMKRNGASARLRVNGQLASTGAT
jgi:hypothetical protein